MRPDDMAGNAERGAVAAIDTATCKDVKAGNGGADDVRGPDARGCVIVTGNAGRSAADNDNFIAVEF